jgi:hypothetical protein
MTRAPVCFCVHLVIQVGVLDEHVAAGGDGLGAEAARVLGHAVAGGGCVAVLSTKHRLIVPDDAATERMFRSDDHTG